MALRRPCVIQQKKTQCPTHFPCTVEPTNFILPLRDINRPYAGLKAEFSCKISKEGLKAEWLKNGKTIEHGEKYNMVDEANTHKLIINNPEAGDGAEYAVKFGEAISKAKLTIGGESTDNWVLFLTLIIIFCQNPCITF